MPEGGARLTKDGGVQKNNTLPLWLAWVSLALLSGACKPPKPTAGGQGGKTPPPASATAPAPSIGLLSARVLPLSDQAVCVFGGWVCPDGAGSPLLRCSVDGGKTFSDVATAKDRCNFV